MWTKSGPRLPLFSERGMGIRRLVVAGFLLAVSCGIAHADAIAVVAHPGVEVDDLSFADLRKIMLADRQFWSTGKRITLIVRAPVALERTVLLEKVYKMSEARYRQYWIAKVFRAEATDGPRVVVSNEEAVDLVSVLEGAITFIDAADVPEGLKLLRIDGHMPGDDEYPFN